MISIGCTVPDLHCEAYLPDGRIEPVGLADYRGRWLVLFFWPLDFTFVCPTEIAEFNKELKRLLHCVVIFTNILNQV